MNVDSIRKKVRINGTGTFWDGKEGTIVNRHGDGSASVAVNFGDGNETLQDFDAEYVESINEDGDSRGAKEEAVYQVMVVHQDYSETLHFIAAKSTKQLEYKIGKIDPYYIDYSIVSEPGKAGNGESREHPIEEEQGKPDYLGMLADLYDVDVSKIKPASIDNPHVFKIGNSYCYVTTEKEAREMAKENILSQHGMFGISPFRSEDEDDDMNYYLMEGIDTDMGSDFWKYAFECVKKQLKKEYKEYPSDLLSQMEENDFISEDDFEDPEEKTKLKRGIDFDSLLDKYIDDYILWYPTASDNLEDVLSYIDLDSEYKAFKKLDKKGLLDWNRIADAMANDDYLCAKWFSGKPKDNREYSELGQGYVAICSNSISGLTESAESEYNPLAEKPKGKKGRNEAMETITNEERRKALADYLGIDIEDVEDAGGDEFDTPDGDYLVLTEDEAYDRALDDIQDTIDDMGMDAFTDYFRDYIINNLLDDYRIREEAIVKGYEGYVEDIEQESSDKFENRLIEELYENGFLHDGDFEDGEDGKDYYRLKPSVDLDDKKYDYAKWLAEDVIVSDWLYDTFGGDGNAMYHWLEENEYVDWDEVKRQCIRDDGIAHFLADYDGKEIELEGDLYAYRLS